jgi:hypothetical protein
MLSAKRWCRQMINMLSEIDQTEFMLAAPQNFIPFDRHWRWRTIGG